MNARDVDELVWQDERIYHVCAILSKGCYEVDKTLVSSVLKRVLKARQTLVAAIYKFHFDICILL